MYRLVRIFHSTWTIDGGAFMPMTHIVFPSGNHYSSASLHIRGKRAKGFGKVKEFCSAGKWDGCRRCSCFDFDQAAIVSLYMCSSNCYSFESCTRTVLVVRETRGPARPRNVRFVLFPGSRPRDSSWFNDVTKLKVEVNRRSHDG
jgi:hypothetical protein